MHPRATDLYWPREELYREGKEDAGAATTEEVGEQGDEEEEAETDA